MPTFDDVTIALRELNDQQHTEFELGDQAIGGMNTGAWHLRDPTGQRAILKLGSGFSLDHLVRAEQAVTGLRTHGYPTPEWLAVGELGDGTRYHVQELIPGQPGDPLTADKARQLVQLLERHEGLDPWPDRDWNAYIVGNLSDDLERLRRTVPAAQELADTFDHLLSNLGAVELPTGDLVHGDFNSCNVLLHEGKLTGAIDIEALGSGSGVIDYAWLLREAYGEGSKDPEISRTLWTAGKAVAGPEALTLCLAFTACDLMLWMAANLPDSVLDILRGMHNLAADLAQIT
jgi:aminoglycoside phosphotransferase (APT) family kinase protein